MLYPYSIEFDPLFIPILACMALGLIVQGVLRSRFNKYGKVAAQSGVTGAQAAQAILRDAGIHDVAVEPARGGALSDHYDPRDKTLRLSPGVYDSTGIAALGVAAHEAGHALQHAEEYAPLRMRNMFLPVVNFVSNFVWVLFIAGVFFSFTGLIYAGIICFACTVAFQLITLPVELNASSRALYALESGGLLRRDEVPAARKVLSAAALTYVVAALMSILQLMRMVGLARRRN